MWLMRLKIQIRMFVLLKKRDLRKYSRGEQANSNKRTNNSAKKQYNSSIFLFHGTKGYGWLGDEREQALLDVNLRERKLSH